MARTNRRSRRTTTATLAATSALALALAGCGSAESDGPVTLEFWGWVPGLEDAVEEWNEANPDIQIDFFRMTGDDGDSVPAAIDAGTAPDVVQMSVHSIPGHIVNNRLTDLSEHADLADAFTDSAWSSVVFDDSVYAIPQDSGPTGLMYRSDLFDEHGVEVPTTWEEYIEAGRALKDADPDLYIGQFSPGETGFWLQSVWQNGGSWYGIDDDAWTVEVAGPESMEVAEIWQTLLDEELVRVIEMWTPEFWAEVNAGTIASIHYAAWFPILLEESAGSTAGNWSVAPSPNFGSQDSAGDTGGSVNVVPTGTEHVAQAVEFITWLNTSEAGVEHLISGGVFPAAVTGHDNPALLQEEEFFGGQVINEVFTEAAEQVPAGWLDGPSYELMQSALQDGLAQVANGQQTVPEALEQVHERGVADLRDMGLDVAE